MTAQPDDGRYAELTDLLRRRRHLRLVSPEGETAEIPDELATKIGEVATAMASGQTVTVFTDESLISTTKAAEILGVSRQTIVRFIESGRLSYSQPGVHRRLRLSDVLAVKLRSEEFQATMSALRDNPAAQGLYEVSLEESAAAVRQVRQETAKKRKSRGDV